MPQKSYDTVIIGGGVIGLATAYYLAEAGVGPIALLERGDLAGEASSANLGGVWAEFEGLTLGGSFRRLAHASRELYAELSAQPGMEFEFRRNGVIALAFSAEEMDILRAQVRACVDDPPACSILDGRAVRELQPGLSEEITGGLHFPRECHVNPLMVCWSLIRALHRRRVELLPRCEVVGADVASGRLLALRTPSGTVRAGRFVNCAGPWAARLPELALPLPIQPGRGQAIVTERVPWQLHTPVFCGISLIQTAGGNVIAGGTLAFTGYDTTAPWDNFRHICSLAARALPRLQDVLVLRTWARLRPHTPDELPIVGGMPGFENVYMNAGHFRNGLLLAPITARLLADWIARGSLGPGLTDLRPMRFLSAIPSVPEHFHVA